MSLFSINFVVFTREFKGQSSGPRVDNWTVECDEIDALHEKLFLLVKPHIKAEVIYDGDAYSFKEGEINAEDLERFVLFQTVSGKKNLQLPQVTCSVLHNWQDMELNLYIHQYGLGVSSGSAYKVVKKQLIDPREVDRAGAATSDIVRDIASQLKEIHKFNFVAADIVWEIWANEISASGSHLRETLMNGPPREKLIELFSRAPTHPDTVVQNIQENVGIGKDMLDANKRFVHSCRQSLNVITDLVGRLSIAVKELDERVGVIENRNDAQSALLASFANAVETVETEFSEETFGLIINQEDVDHI